MGTGDAIDLTLQTRGSGGENGRRMGNIPVELRQSNRVGVRVCPYEALRRSAMRWLAESGLNRSARLACLPGCHNGKVFWQRVQRARAHLPASNTGYTEIKIDSECEISEN